MAEDEAQRPEQAVNEAKRQEIAYQLYQNRQLLSKPGDVQQDWETAGQILRSPIRSLLFKLHGLFIGVERRAWEPILHWANNQAWLSLLSVVGNVGPIIAATSYVCSEKLRRDAEVFTAW
ncbi:MAG: hypothetical protein HC857_17205 [Synechococcales cyanobacterium RU_4_20]|nr:hypothetical protein [Synechococcales cyanobacterium RU_4_20]NJR69713.1 hypothetical protein [Synechococcales cyanobacterium CRU_2_2]